jgi:hypothetical protein
MTDEGRAYKAQVGASEHQSHEQEEEEHGE